MFLYFFFAAMIWIIDLVFSFLPKVTELPFGLDSIMASAVGTVQAVISMFPPLQIVWICVLAAVIIRMSLLTYHISKWFIERIH